MTNEMVTTPNQTSDFANTGNFQSPQESPNTVAPTPSEKLLRQSEVNDLVGRVKRETEEKVRNEYDRRQYEISNAPGNQTAPAQPNLDELRKIASEQAQQEIQRSHYQQQGQRLASEIDAQLMDARSRYDDFDKVVKSDTLSQIPDVLLLTHGLQNGGDVVYDLLKNPSKLANVTANLMAARLNQSPFYHDLAAKQIQEIATSIKANQQAVENKPQVDAPLSQISPSNVGADSGKRTISDLRSNPMYRG